MARTRLKGKGITFTYDDTAYECDLTSVVLLKDTADTATTDSTLTFCDVSAGQGSGDIWKMNITAIQSGETTPEVALQQLIWDLAETGGELAFVFAPYGNAEASANQPHYTGVALVPVGGYPRVGGDAGENTWTFDYEFVVKDDEVKRETTSSVFAVSAKSTTK